MKKIAFITPPDACWGFSLGGVPQYAVKIDEADKTLDMALSDPENGLVIVDERMLQGMTEERLRELERAGNGLLLVLPSPEKPPEEAEDYAARLIRRAIGYHVRLKI